MVLLGTTFLVAFTWTLSIVKEAGDFPADYADRVVEDRRLDLKGATKDEYRAIVANDVRAWVDSQYAPGGVIGYVSWVTASGQFVKGDIASARTPYRHPHRKGLWLIRCGLSVALLAFGIGSQTFGLREPRQGTASPRKDNDES